MRSMQHAWQQEDTRVMHKLGQLGPWLLVESGDVRGKEETWTSSNRALRLGNFPELPSTTGGHSMGCLRCQQLR